MKETTKYMSNAPKVLEELDMLCHGRVPGKCRLHRRSGVIATESTFHLKLCRAMISGMMKQIEDNGCKDFGEIGLGCRWERPEMEMVANVEDQEVRDDLSGQPLRRELVAEARGQEMQFFEAKKVLQKVPRGTARAMTGRGPIAVRSKATTCTLSTAVG